MSARLRKRDYIIGAQVRPPPRDVTLSPPALTALFPALFLRSSTPRMMNGRRSWAVTEDGKSSTGRNRHTKLAVSTQLQTSLCVCPSGFFAHPSRKFDTRTMSGSFRRVPAKFFFLAAENDEAGHISRDAALHLSGPLTTESGVVRRMSGTPKLLSSVVSSPELRAISRFCEHMLPPDSFGAIPSKGRPTLNK